MPSPQFLALQEALAGRYSLERELGRGGMGIVYLAQEVRLDRPVALKVLPPEYATQPRLRERFLREARTAARLSHPHIVPIYAVHELEESVLFAMAYVEGETLGERIREEGPLPPAEAARLLREVSWALGYAHAQGVVHRDVKPDNILIEAETGRALVTDFGIAYVREGEGPEVDPLLGTVEFMSPEHARGQEVDERSDLYSLGVVGYYALSGRLPLQGDTPTATLAKHLSESPPPLARIVPGLPAPLTQAVDRCLAKEPAGRFAHGEELAEALGDLFKERRDVPAPLRLFIKQSRESTAVLAALQALSIGGVGMGIAGFLDGVPLIWVLLTAGGSLALASLPTAVLMRMARRLMQSGHDRGDLVRAMRAEVERAHAELVSAYGSEESRLDRWLKRLLVGGLGLTGGTFGWILLGPYVPGVSEIVGLAMTGAGIVGVGAAAVAAARHQLSGHVPGRGWLRFWESPLGRALFKVSGAGLKRLPTGAYYGPTELVIGLAAERLFEALPTDQRTIFRELPAVVRRLEDDAEEMRRRIEELDTLMAEAGESEPRDGEALAQDLVGARAATEARLREVVAALETIRVQLLRLHAGAASVEGVTRNLGAARELSDDVQRMLEGRREVERLLGHSSENELAASPTPA